MPKERTTRTGARMPNWIRLEPASSVRKAASLRRGSVPDIGLLMGQLDGDCREAVQFEQSGQQRPIGYGGFQPHDRQRRFGDRIGPGHDLQRGGLVAPTFDKIGRSATRIPGLGEIRRGIPRSEEHTSELQSLMRISYAVLCLKKNTTH